MSTPQAPTGANTGAPAAPQLNFINVLQRMLAVSDKVSDLIFSPGRPPQVELMGELQPVVAGLEKLTARAHGRDSANNNRQPPNGRREP